MKTINDIKQEVADFSKDFAIKSVGFSAMLPGMEWMYTDCYMNVRNYLNSKSNIIRPNDELLKLERFINDNWKFYHDTEVDEDGDEISIDRIEFQSKEVQDSIIELFSKI